MITGGEAVYKYHKDMGRDPRYVLGVLDALKWVLRKGESPLK